MRVNEAAHENEELGDFIWRMAHERILTEEFTDEIANFLGNLIAAIIPFPFPWKKRVVVWAVDKHMPQYGLVAVRKILHITRLISLEQVGADGRMQTLSERYPIPGVDPHNPFLQ